MQLVECVPNFSEGRDPQKIEAITKAMTLVKGVTVLDVDMGSDANRTVVTLVCPPESLVEVGFRGIEAASQVIDMRQQQGAHPRIGATDVFPIVPFHDISMEECILLSQQLSERVGRELEIPVYLYEESTTILNRKSLSSIRSGEYERLNEKINDPDWKPDFGPQLMHEKAGATAIGARSLLIAFNINLATQNLKIAKSIAAEIRESGKRTRQNGQSGRVPGLLRACKAIGWNMPGYGLTQVSTNLTDYKTTPPHKVYETCKSLAIKYGTIVAGSELIGLIPRQAMLMAGQYYADQNGMKNVMKDRLIKLAVEAMGLNSFYLFDPKKKILENRLRQLLNSSL